MTTVGACQKRQTNSQELGTGLDTALYIMFCQAMSVGDKIRAEACMDLSKREGINSLEDPVFGSPQKENGKKSAETKS